MMKKNLLILSLLFLGGILSGVEVVNAGVGGHNSRNGAERIENLLKQNTPQVLIVSYALNDVCYDENLVNAVEFKANLKKIIEKAMAHKVRLIALCTVNDVVPEYLLKRHKYHDKRDLNLMIEEYNQIIKKTAMENNCILIDFNQAFNAAGGASTSFDSLIRNAANSKAEDGIHLTPQGYTLLGEIVFNALSGKLQKEDTILCVGDSVTYGYGGKNPGEVSQQSESYPAVLGKLAKKKFGETFSPVLSNSSSVFYANFDAMKIGIMPKNFVLQNKSGDSMKIIGLQSGKGLEVIPGNNQSQLFFRSELFKAAGGKYKVMFKVRGDGEFLPKIMYYTPAKGIPEGTLVLSDKYIAGSKDWQNVEFEIEVPAKTSQLSLAIQVKRGSMIFASIELAAVVKTASVKTRPEYFLRNSNLLIGLADVSQGGGVVTLKNAEGTEFINLNPDLSLWSIKLKKIKFDNSKYPEIVQLFVDPEQDDGNGSKNEDAKSDLNVCAAEVLKLGGNCRVEKFNNGIKLFWDDLTVGSEKKALSVWAELKFDKSGRFLLADGGFQNKSEIYTVFYFALPQIGGLGKINGRSADDYLATPFFNGRLIKNPTEKGLFKSNKIFQPNRSGHSMQFDLLYNNGAGLYLGTFDGEQYAKRYLLESDNNNGLTYAVYNIPNNMRKVPQNWQIPYSSGMTCFQGDYYDGAQIYREWAIRQRWCKEGIVAERKNLPEWFKAIDEWQLMSIFNNNMTLFKQWVNDIAKDFSQYNIGVELCHWGTNHNFHAGTPDRFPLDKSDVEQMQVLKDKNWPIMGYLQHTAWSNKSSSFLNNSDSKKNLVRNYYNQALKWPDDPKIDESCVIAYPGELWQSILIESIKNMAKSGFRAAYMDSGNHGGTYMNFTPDCSSDSGGGTGYVHKNWELLEKLRTEARKIVKDFCFTSESFWEGNIAHLDGFLTVNTTNAYLETDRVSAIPLAQIVYHDYTIMFALWPSNGDVERDNARGYVAKHGLAFCWGIKPGWNVYNLLYKRVNSPEVVTTSIKRYDAYRAGKTYFVNGRLMREPKITNLTSADKLELTWNVSWGNFYYDKIKMDKVLGGFFKNPNGDCALALYNIDEAAQRVVVDLSHPEYNISNLKMNVLYPETLKVEVNNRQLILMVAPRSPIVIEWKK